ncbi:MAG: hypothetical protein AAGA48_11815 [Myxococcota bacterium]
MVSLVGLALTAVAAPVSSDATDALEDAGVEASVADPCLARRAVRPCDALQLALHTERGTFDAYVFSMHHAQAGVYWFQDRQSGAFLKVSTPRESRAPFLGEGWSIETADGATYEMERVIRETYVLRLADEEGLAASHVRERPTLSR